MTYTVNHMKNGDIGVYDDERACYPIAGPELRAAGIKRIEPAEGRWFRGEEGKAEAERIAAILNEFHGHIENATKALKKVAKATEKAEDSLKDMANALVADQA